MILGITIDKWFGIVITIACAIGIYIYYRMEV